VFRIFDARIETRALEWPAWSVKSMTSAAEEAAEKVKALSS
jgi:hypothetical protein